MKKPYTRAEYEVTLYSLSVADILTLSSDRENAYVPSDTICGEFTPGGDDYD